MPPSPYVTLISSDGFEFIVSRDAACVAGTIKKMLDPQSACLSHAIPYPPPNKPVYAQKSLSRNKKLA